MKLTRTFKENLVDRVVSATMKSRRDEEAAKRKEFWEYLYSLIYNPEQISAMNRIPAGWLTTSNYIRVSLSDNSCDVREYLRGDTRKFLAMDTDRAFDGSAWPLAVKKKIRDKEKALSDISIENRDAARELRLMIERLVSPITTLKKLKEMWPECVPYLPVEEEKVENLPAVMAEGVNNLIAQIKGESK